MEKLSIHQRLAVVLQIILLIEVFAATWNQHWLTALITLGILLLTLAPTFLSRFFNVFIPPEFVLLAIVFVFASLFLGEIHEYYTRFWWWDIVLHSSSGFL